MKLNRKLLQRKCKENLNLVKFLDLSGLGLVTLDHVDLCPSLQWLITSDNKLQSDDGLEQQTHLWHLDLSNNEISMLGTLSRYLALGTLILSNNNLKWVDLEKIRHAHIMSICLHGNPCLDLDPYYRIHVIDCLPLIWELDGRLVTVTERLHVKQFFIDTELSQHPVRHKMGKSFRTSAIKNIGTEGIVSKQCKYIYSKFPMSETHTKHTDERRLVYLTHMVQEDIMHLTDYSEKRGYRRSVMAENFLDNLLEQRQKDPERCNMVMLLLVISLEFQLPTALMRSVLNVSNLDTIGVVNTMPLFLLPAKHRTRVICVLLNAAKLQRDNNKNHTGGLYPQLFMCLYYTVAQLVRIGQTSDAHMHKIKQIPLNSDYRALMAGEVVSLMLNVPRFYSYVTSDNGVLSLLECATGSPEVVAKSQELVAEAEDIFSMMSVRAAHRRMKALVTRAILDRVNSINVSMSDIPIGDRYLSLSDSLPIKPLHSVIWASEFLTNGLCVPRLEPPILYPVKESHKPKPLQPEIGDKVLLGPQVVGEMTMIMEGDIALVKVGAVTLANGGLESRLKSSEAHYTYVDLQALCFARDIGMWRPIKTQGDKHTIHSVGTNDLLAITQKEALVNDPEKAQPEVRTPITKTLMVYAPKTSQVKRRPQSAIVGGQKPHGSDRRAVSAQPPDTNTNFASSRFHLESDWCQENDLNQNEVNELHVTSRNILAHQPDQDTGITDVTGHDGVLEPNFESPVANMPENFEPQEYTAPLPSRSSSPLPSSLHVIKETSRATSDEGFTQELMTRGSVSEQEAASSSPAQQQHQQELHQYRDTGGSPTVTWPNQGPGNEDSTSNIALSDRKDIDSFSHEQGSAAVAGFEETFLTTVNGQDEGLDTSAENQLGSEVRGAEGRSVSAGGNHVNFQDPLIATGRPKTSRPTRTFKTNSGRKIRQLPGRSYSAADVKKSPIGPRTSPLMSSTGGLGSDFQQSREDLSKGLNPPARYRPATAVRRRSDLVQTPPQRPPSPVSTNTAKSCGIKVTSTRTWLGGGRDLHWEDVQRRPKSGHTPGWRDGMPDSMRKHRSKSAHVTLTRHSDFGFLSLDAKHQITDDDITSMMPEVHPLFQYLPRLASSPASDDDQTFFPPLTSSVHVGWRA